MTISISSPILNEKRFDDSRPQRGQRLHGVILLAGGSSQTAFSAATQRAALDLPVTESAVLSTLWQRALLSVIDRFETSPVPVRIVGGHASTVAAGFDHASISISSCEDPQSFRGTGGVLRDLAMDYHDDAYLLIASAAALLLRPLDQLLDELLATGSDVAFHVHDDGTASTIMLVRCGCLRSIPSVGFIDLKEQALAHHIDTDAVSIVRTARPVAISMRSPAKYLRALRLYHRQFTRAGRSSSRIAFAEDWRPVFRIVEAGAQLGANVRVHDAVVLSGAQVDDGALIARSIICRGARIPANASVIDRVVTASGSKSIVEMAGVRR